MNYKLELTEQEVNLVLQSLGKLPLENSIELFVKIKNECEKQLKDGDKD
jgi:exonuclease VII small subunit